MLVTVLISESLLAAAAAPDNVSGVREDTISVSVHRKLYAYGAAMQSEGRSLAVSRSRPFSKPGNCSSCEQTIGIASASFQGSVASRSPAKTDLVLIKRCHIRSL